MKTVLLPLALLVFSCSQESEESKQLKEQNNLLKKQIETLSKKEVAKPVDLAAKVSGTYITYQIEDFDKGTTQQLPSDGLSRVFKIEAMGTKKIMITETTSSKGLLGGAKTGTTSYKASVSKTNDDYGFNEIWENGEYEAYGTFNGDEFTEITKRRSDGKLMTKVVSRK